MASTFYIEIAAGIASGVALYVLGEILFRFIAPTYRSWVNRSPPLAGTWKYFDSEEGDAPEVGTAIFSQRGDSLKVSATRIRRHSGQICHKQFTYHGYVRHGQIQLDFEESTSNGFASGNLVLKISSDQKDLQGFTVFFNHDKGKVVAHPIYFKRSN